MKIIFNKNDVWETKITFGKYKGWSFAQILWRNPSYIIWLYADNIIENFPEEIYKEAARCCRERLPNLEDLSHKKHSSSGYIDDTFMWATNDIEFYC